MIYFNNIFRIPGPKDLGMSKSNNSMAWEEMPNFPGELTWADYYARVKMEYPVRFFFASTVPGFFRGLWLTISRRPKDAIYWLKCHLIPAHRYHMIDIRQPADPRDPCSKYTHGWMDSDHRMVLAMMSLLVDFIEKEAPGGYHIPSEEDAANDDNGTNPNQFTGCRVQRNNWLELKAIYDYWKNERFTLEQKYLDALTKWCEARKKLGCNDAEVMRLNTEMNAAEEASSKRLEEMLHRLLVIRHCLWT